VGEVEDFMPVGQMRAGERQRLVRRVVAVRGQMSFALDVVPPLALETDIPLELRDGDVHSSFSLEAGESATFVLEHVPGDYEPHGHPAEQMRELFEGTVAYWRRYALLPQAFTHLALISAASNLDRTLG
jgi:hypothetical protein